MDTRSRLLGVSLLNATPVPRSRARPRRPYSLALGLVAVFAVAFAMIGAFLP